MTQIRAPRLDDDTVNSVKEVIRQAQGSDEGLEVSVPSMRLEDFFLDVVAAAQKERLVTGGAEKGTAAAAFLVGEHEGETLLDELVEAGAGQEETAADAQEPVAAIPVQADHELIDDLVGSAAFEQTESGAEPDAAVTPEMGVREDVLSELLADAGQDGESDVEKD